MKSMLNSLTMNSTVNPSMSASVKQTLSTTAKSKSVKSSAPLPTRSTPIGGQAVIEGVMMRNRERFSVAVRLPNGKIKVRKEQSSSFAPFFNVFFIRGIIGLGYMLKDGLTALVWSSNQQLEQEEKISGREIASTMALSALAVLLIFVAVPFFTARLFLAEGPWFNLLEGLIRVGLFLGYLGIISRMKEVQTLFQYHGAEHKTIYCYEAGKKVTIGNVQLFPKEHHRCGTAFIFLVLIISIFVFSLLTGSWWTNVLGRMALLPVVAGIGYELIKLGEKFKGKAVMRALLLPGMWLQAITTKEPTNQQVEVAMKALEGVVTAERVKSD